MNREQAITSIMFECFPYDPDHFTCFVDATRIRIAAQRIAELYEENLVGKRLDGYIIDDLLDEMQSHGDEPV